MKRDKILNNIIKIGLILYTIIVIMVLVLKMPANMDIWNEARTRFPMQLIPFKTIIEYASQVHSLTDWFIKNLACNVIMFIPYGLFMPYILKTKKRFMMVCIFATLFSGLIEMVQYALAIGKFDIDDIILNLFGAIVGYGINLVIKKICK